MTETSSKATGLWACDLAYCDYIYNPQIGDPSQGVEPGTPLAELPDTWTCPKCGITKEYFHPYEL